MMTSEDYERLMSTIRESFAYRVLRLLNAPEEASEQAESVPATSKFSNVNNYYLLEKVYSILQDNYLRGEKFDEAELIYGATE